jgi:tRNA pseudouridine38-40 synthase
MSILKNYKIVLCLEYDGSQFHGWQRQSNLRTVQFVLEEALAKVANEPITVFCAGRTDAGVHATHQVIHFETQTQRPLSAWVLGTNTFLPADVRVFSAKEVSEDFHARFSALSRCYQYHIINQPIKPALARNYLSWEYRPLNIEWMNQAAEYFLGEQDFSSFRSAECQSNSPYRRIDHLFITREENKVIIDIQANAFLHHMVRNIAGVLIDIGAGIKPPQWAAEVIAARDRRKASVTASASGLFLVDVHYPALYSL